MIKTNNKTSVSFIVIIFVSFFDHATKDNMKVSISKKHVVDKPVKWDIVIHNLLDKLITSTVDFLIKLYSYTTVF